MSDLYCVIEMMRDGEVIQVLGPATHDQALEEVLALCSETGFYSDAEVLDILEYRNSIEEGDWEVHIYQLSPAQTRGANKVVVHLPLTKFVKPDESGSGDALPH